MRKLLKKLIAASAIAVALVGGWSHQSHAAPVLHTLTLTESVLFAGNSDETVEVSILLVEKHLGNPCSLSFEIEANDATSFGAPLQNESVMLGPGEFTAVQFLFSLSLPTASGTHALLLTVTDVKKTGGCKVRSYVRIVGPGGETRSVSSLHGQHLVIVFPG